MTEKKSGGWGIFFILKSLLFLVVLAAAFCAGFGMAFTKMAGASFLLGVLVMLMILNFGKWLTKGWILSGWYHLFLGYAAIIAYYAGFLGGLVRSGADQAVQSIFLPW